MKDIRDEVNMVENVLQSQLEVFEKVLSSFKQKIERNMSNGLYEEDIWSRISDDRTIYVLRQRWQRLREDAERVEKSVGLVKSFRRY